MIRTALFQHRVRLLRRARLGQPEFGHQPILQSAPQPLDPPLRLWREGIDHLDLEGGKRLAHLGRPLSPTQFLFEAPVVVVAFETPVLIHVGAPRQPLLLGNRFEHLETSCGAFLLDEMGSLEQLARRVVHRAHQTQHRTTSFEPIMSAPVPQDHQSRLRLTIPATAMLRRSPLARCADARRP